MSTQPTTLVHLVAYYNDLLTRFALRLTTGKKQLADALVKDAMEEAWEENKFYEGKELRRLLKNKIVARLEALKKSPNKVVPGL